MDRHLKTRAGNAVKASRFRATCFVPRHGRARLRLGADLSLVIGGVRVRVCKGLLRECETEVIDEEPRRAVEREKEARVRVLVPVGRLCVLGE